MKPTMILSVLLAVPVCWAQSAPTPAAQVDSFDSYANPANRTRENAPALESRRHDGSDIGGARTLSPPVEAAPSRITTPLTSKSEFEIFAEDAAGRSLVVYGRQLFDEAPTTFAPMDHIPVPADYVIGPGDELLVRVWGKIELESSVTVDRNGQIFIPRVGALAVAGLRYEQLEGSIHAAIASLYKGFDLNVTMGQLRSIQIFVLGSARQPGVYTVSSLSTLVNALFASGGPSATGSMRHIQLRRGNQVLTEFDVYELLRNGDKSHDVKLLPGDVIYIPPSGPQAAILGSVNEPGIYELKGNDTTIASILREVAGLTNLASVDRALLERVEDHHRRQVDEFALDDAGLQRPLRDGDILRIFPISPRFENAVTLRGNVAQPGRYLWHDGMRVSDLIPNREVLLTREYWNQQNFLASTLPAAAINADSDGEPAAAQPPARGNRPEHSSPVIHPQSQFSEHWDHPRPKADAPNRDVMTDVVETATEINWEYAAIERRDDKDLSTRIIPFNLARAIDTPSSTDNQALKPGDVLTIFSRRDVPLPQDKHAAFVRIGGEVNAPGVYRIESGETLRDLVIRAGGLTPHSYLYASQLTRASTRLAQEEELRLATAQMQREMTARYAGASSLAPGSATEQQSQFNSQQAMLTQLSAVHPTGRIVLDMKPSASSIADIPLFPLEDGDNFYVPAALGTVQVAGAVYNENAFRYQPAKHLSSYLKAAGGPTRQADTKRIFLIRADGTVVSRQHENTLWSGSFERLRVLPGDAIVVPTKLKSPGNFMQQLPFWTQMLSQTALMGTVIGTY